MISLNFVTLFTVFLVVVGMAGCVDGPQDGEATSQSIGGGGQEEKLVWKSLIKCSIGSGRFVEYRVAENFSSRFGLRYFLTTKYPQFQGASSMSRTSNPDIMMLRTASESGNSVVFRALPVPVGVSSSANSDVGNRMWEIAFDTEYKTVIQSNQGTMIPERSNCELEKELAAMLVSKFSKCRQGSRSSWCGHEKYDATGTGASVRTYNGM